MRSPAILRKPKRRPEPAGFARRDPLMILISGAAMTAGPRHPFDAGALHHDDRNDFAQSIAWRLAGCLQTRRPRNRHGHELFGLRPAASRRCEAAGGLVS